MLAHHLTFDPAFAPDFALPDCFSVQRSLSDLMGSAGALLGFIGDIWQPASVRRILWLQRHASKFTLMGAPISVLVRDEPHTLHGFRMSSPLPVPFQLLADADGRIHKAYHMDQAGLALVDRAGLLRAKWAMRDDGSVPRIQDLVSAIQKLQI